MTHLVLLTHAIPVSGIPAQMLVVEGAGAYVEDWVVDVAVEVVVVAGAE